MPSMEITAYTLLLKIASPVFSPVSTINKGQPWAPCIHQLLAVPSLKGHFPVPVMRTKCLLPPAFER